MPIWVLTSDLSASYLIQPLSPWRTPRRPWDMPEWALLAMDGVRRVQLKPRAHRSMAPRRLRFQATEIASRLRRGRSPARRPGSSRLQQSPSPQLPRRSRPVWVLCVAYHHSVDSCGLYYPADPLLQVAFTDRAGRVSSVRLSRGCSGSAVGLYFDYTYDHRRPSLRTRRIHSLSLYTFILFSGIRLIVSIRFLSAVTKLPSVAHST